MFGVKMDKNENELDDFFLQLIKFITRSMLDHSKNESKTLKMITIAVQSVINK